MDFNNLDDEYISLVKDIIDNDKFKLLKKCEHHGISRYEHSVKVSYNAYKFAKKHGLNYKEVAVGGLLHDFFLDENYGVKRRIVSTFTHPNKAMSNAVDSFGVNEKEKNIIRSHMFPFTTKIPKYKESWTVILFDKTIGTREFLSKFSYKLRYAGNLMLLLLFNFIK